MCLMYKRKSSYTLHRESLSWVRLSSLSGLLKNLYILASITLNYVGHVQMKLDASRAPGFLAEAGSGDQALSG